MSELIVINFVMEGKDYAGRVWPTVPRIGEHVSLHYEGEKRVAKVHLVVWGVREETVFGRQLECDVHILWDDPQVPRTAQNKDQKA